ncbi:MAG: hypothetical protein IKP22_00810 [Clostridia bacterium]|nr:hypothetical protein [Clostridia bacterium]
MRAMKVFLALLCLLRFSGSACSAEPAMEAAVINPGDPYMAEAIGGSA